MRRTWQPLAILFASAAYAFAGFHFYWTRGPVDLSLSFAGMVVLPAAYGVVWQIVGRGNGELGLRAFVASGVWYAAILFLVLAHYPPLASLHPRRQWSDLAYSALLLCPLLIALGVSGVQSRAMAGILANVHRSAT